MQNNFNNIPNVLDFGEPTDNHSIIKVIGVGGGGGNAVNHMYRQGIHDVSFVLCNTDRQALSDSNVPVKVQLGTEGLGAGNKPEKARAAAEESIDDVRQMLNDGTKMAFITAGMGGGTGTGAAPVIARVSKELNILTVGIVTIPFRFEGEKKIDQALDGVEEMSKNVDAMLVINNERLREIYPHLTVIDAFGKADDTLSVAAKGIAEIITIHGLINLDFNDVKTVLKDGGVAIMSTGYGEGEGRVRKAIDDALNSPLLNDNDIFSSKKILLSISFGNDKENANGLTMEEMGDVHNFMSKFKDFEIKWGLAVDHELERKVKVTIIATGYGLNCISGMDEHNKKYTQQDAQIAAEQAERDAEKDSRRKKYYGDESSAPHKNKPKVFIFDIEDLDNDEIIGQVDELPTYKRTSKTLRDIKDIVTTPEPTILPNPVDIAAPAPQQSEIFQETPDNNTQTPEGDSSSLKITF